MKKIIFIFLLISLYPEYNNLYHQEDNIKEQLIPTTINGKLIGVKDIITIPKNYHKNIITIKPNIFNYINNYKHLNPGEEIKIELQINNNSKYNYKYINDSFKLDIKELLENENNNNLEEIGIGFNNKKIYNNYMVYRTYNEAIFYLYDQDKYKNNYLSDENLNNKLKHYGYSGIDELDKYYLDYYNDKYNVLESNLNNYEYKVKKDIFSGQISTYKETNNSINELAYNYYYNKLLYYKINTNEYSIGTYIKKNNIIKDLNERKVLSNNKLIINNMYLGLNDYYYSEVFNEYGLYLTMELKFKILK
ncbi:MAG: hypothetical protein E7160_01400 [Firmicutes bacterium]|nr:hypothetical protein [Bacillota bacterium]